MRNIFDQYSQPENRLTHALVSTLAADRSLIRPFLSWAGADRIPKLSDLRLTEQQVPGGVVTGEEQDGRGLPDACVFSQEGWALLIEAKIQASIDSAQLQRHVATARRHGYDSPHLLVLSVDKPSFRLPARCEHREWRMLYAWLCNRPDPTGWIRRLTEYIEVFESRMLAEDYSIRGTLTMFNGLRFDEDNPYSYHEAKRLIRLLGDELQKRQDLRQIGVDPKGARRTAITGSAEARIWDFLPLTIASDAPNFTAFPHLTIGIGASDASAAITVPNGVQGGFKTKLRQAGEEGFIGLLERIQKRADPTLRRTKGAKAKAYALQRHYRSQRSSSETDARVEADLRTVIPGSRREAKFQPEWVQAIYQVLTQKRSNIQFGLVIELSYGCPIVRSAEAVDLFAESWIAMSPLIDFVLSDT